MSFHSRIESSHSNIYTKLHATPTMKHKETMIATLMLNYCNIYWSIRLLTQFWSTHKR